MQNPRVSVIICTYNRADYLENCIQSLNAQTYTNIEIIIVNGPSTDDTHTVLSKYLNIKIINQKELNGLSIARNLGIDKAYGEIIAFIDDDAVADRNWIKNLVVHYKDNHVGAVGGFVVFPDNVRVQFDNGVINKNGIPVPIRKNNTPLKKDEFRILMGTNCSFRRSLLNNLGGFDPYFRYYHDESDMCVRVILAGYAIVYEKNAVVMHEMAEGHNRKSLLDMRWDQIVKNVIFFTLKNFGNSPLSYTTRPLYAVSWWFWRFTFICLWKREISVKDLLKIFWQMIKGAVRGYKKSFLSFKKIQKK